MKRSFDLFGELLEGTKVAAALYDYFEDKVKPPLDYSDLLRWRWAQSVSVLDKFIHDIVRIGMVEIYEGRRVPTRKYLGFPLNLSVHTQMVDAKHDAVLLFDQQITIKNGFLSFQDPDKISDALSYIWDESHKWKCIADKLGFPEPDVRTQLKNISIRRNQIVHEGDYASNLLSRQPIHRDDVDEVLRFIEQIGATVYELVK